MATKIKITYSKTYTFEEDLLQEYLEQLMDYTDTPEQREWFVIDRFIAPNALDPSADLTVEEW